MSDFKMIEDFAKKNLLKVPKEILTLKNLKMLYLEGNFLQEIPFEVFTNLSELTWLDVRNNQLKSIPKSILNHLHLETLLLQDNLIEELPTELGFVPNLRIMHISGNPIKYPKTEILEGGLRAIIAYLQNNYFKNNKLSENSHNIPKPTEFRCYLNEKDFCTNIKTTESNIIVLKPTPKFITKIRKKEEKTQRNKTKYSIYKNPNYSNSRRCINMLPAKQNDLRISDQFMKDIWMDKLKKVMQNQQQLLQKEQNREALRKWRKTTKNQNKTSDAAYKHIAPFYYDKKYDRIPSRYELINNKLDNASSSKRVASIKVSNVNIEKLINDIISSLKQMENEKHIEKSPKEQMDYAGREFKRILDLQKRISALKINNQKSLKL